MAQKKITQNDLRKFMTQHKKKLLEVSRKVESPLAKYLPDGTLKCILCENTLKSDALWSIHISSKQHKDNIIRKKKQQSASFQAANEDVAEFKLPLPPDRQFNGKRSASPVNLMAPPPAPPPPKKLKGILKNAPPLPSKFFDTERKSKEDNTSSNPSLETSKSEPMDTSDNAVNENSIPVSSNSDEVEMSQVASSDSSAPDSDLPEGFFDNPILDAKARKVEYKDPIEEEWEKFQKEMKEEVSVSARIIQDESDESTVERQILEVDEQINNWSRVLTLEKKKEDLHNKVSIASEIKKEEMSDSSGDEDIEEFVSWRTKNSFK